MVKVKITKFSLIRKGFKFKWSHEGIVYEVTDILDTSINVSWINRYGLSMKQLYPISLLQKHIDTKEVIECD
jgi:hypothetical protein